MNRLFPELQSIRIRRKKLNISQNEFAKSVGISQSMLTKIENGVVVPSYKKAADIFEKLEELEHRDEKTAKEIMKKNVIKLRTFDTVGKAAKYAKSYGVSQFPVVDKGKIIGSIETPDLIDMDLSTRIGFKFNPPFPTMNESTPVSIIREVLKYQRAIIVVKKGEIEGIITAEDLL